MNCFMCKGRLEDQLTTFMIDLNSCIIIIKNVPSQVCSQCGEVSYNNEIAHKLEHAVNFLRAMVSDVGVFEYSKVVA